MSEYTTHNITLLMSVWSGEKSDRFNVALRSLANQTLPLENIILVVDGPVNGEIRELISFYSKTLPIRTIELSSNQGLHGALNHGLMQIETEWVMRFDSDDICTKDRVKRQIAYILSNPNVSLFGAQIYEFKEYRDKFLFKRDVPCGPEDIKRTIKWRNPFNHMTVCFKADVARRLGGYPSLPLMEDYALWIRFISEGYEVRNMEAAVVIARAGDDFLRRRGGLKYLKSEAYIQKLLFQSGLKSILFSILGLFLRSTIFISPLLIRKVIYRLVLRVRVINEGEI